MMRRNLLRAAVSACVLASLAWTGGCALTTKAQPTQPRYFSPELPPSAAREPARTTGLELRLGRVRASAHIRERFVYRNSKYEMGFHDDILWTEKPDAYLRRALAQALFEEAGVRSVLSGAAPTLDIELVNFEEIRGPQHVALVRVTVVLRNDRAVQLEQTLTVEKPIAQAAKPNDPSVVAAALGEALRGTIQQIGERILRELAQPGKTS